MTFPSESQPFGADDLKSPDVRLTPQSRCSDSADAETVGLESSSSRLYHVYHTAVRYDYRISDANKNHRYFVYNSHLTPNKADLTFHTGEDHRAPVAGVSKFIHLSRHFKLGLGDPQQVGTMMWEDLLCQNLTMTKYRWQTSIRSANGGLERRSFVWKRTTSHGAEGESVPIFSLRNFKLVDEITGGILAVFTSNSFKSVRKCGKLQVVADYGPEFDLMALISILSMYEKIRRRTGGKGGGGGGGGGDGG